MKHIVTLAVLLFAAAAHAQQTYVSVNFSSGKVATDGVSNYSNGGTIEDRYDDSHHLKLFRGQSFSFQFRVGHSVSRATLKLKHLSSASQGKAGQTPVSVYVNGSKVASWRSLSAGYQSDDVNISKYLRHGTNSVELRYSSGSGSTGYWLKYAQVYIW